MADVEIYKIDNLNLQLVANDTLINKIANHFSAFIKNKYFHPLVKSKRWDGKVFFLNKKSHIISIGFLKDLLCFCESHNYSYKLQFKIDDLINDISKDKLELFYKSLFENTKYTPYDYQAKAVYLALKNKIGIIHACTGSGKSLMLYIIIRYLALKNKNILLVVPSTSLCEQIRSDFLDYGWKDVDDNINILYAGKKIDKNKKILISTWQSIFENNESFFKNVDILMVDECHGARSVSIQKISQKCKNAECRIGVTGSMPPDPCEYKTVQSALGRELIYISSEKLIDRNILSQITIANILLRYSQESIENCKKRSYPEEMNLILEHPLRNRIFKWIFDKIPDGQNSLILVNKINQLNSIKDFLEKNLDKKYKIKVITGRVKTENREEIRKETEDETNVIILATYGTMSVGVNIKRLHNLILGTPRKSYISIVQSIGRGLRTHEQKEKLIVFDIADDLSYERKITRGYRKGTIVIEKNYCMKQFDERLQIYTNVGFEYFTKKVNLNLIGR